MKILERENTSNFGEDPFVCMPNCSNRLGSVDCKNLKMEFEVYLNDYNAHQ